MKLQHLLLAQLNPVVGDLSGNADKILAAYRTAPPGTLVIAPELALIGYPPEDLLLAPAFRAKAMEEAKKLAAATAEAGLIFGTVWEEKGAIYNTAIFASEGRIQHMHYKNMLPNYGVFDEKRYFIPGHTTKVFEWAGTRIAMMVCEDIWHLQFAKEIEKQHAELIVVINASPFEAGKFEVRRRIVSQAASATGVPIVYVNMVGGQDDVVFDGASFVISKNGYIVSEAPQFAETNHLSPLPVKDAQANVHPLLGEEETLWKAITTGLRDYVRKNGFKEVLLGLSGGIDSALSAALAVDALGKENVRGVLLPSPYTSAHSNEDALESAKLLGIRTDTIPISEAMETYKHTLAPIFGRDANWMENPSTGGNLQARIRGMILMAISNQSGAMLLSTGNKSEIAVGYSTLYGDSCGGYNCLKDVYKTEVYRLAHWRNNQSLVIPHRSISKAPSAELKPGQKDSDQLPEYSVLDPILHLHIEEMLAAEEIVKRGFDAATVARVVQMVRNSEYKRRQSPPGVKISKMIFGKDRRYPLTNGFKL